MSTRGPLASILLALVLAAGGAALPGPAAAAGRHPFYEDIAHPRDFVPQASFVQCVGASMQMMLNVIEPGADHSARTQRQLQNLARAWSGPAPDGFVRRGASVRGWVAGLIIHRAGAYRLVGADTLQGAMRVAAVAIRTYRRPVGLLVWQGRHAWVMTGYRATGDPLLDPGFRVTGVSILDPLYPYGSAAWGPSPAPGSSIPVEAVGRQFVPRRSSGSWSHLPGADWLAGKYVLVVPSGQVRPGVD